MQVLFQEKSSFSRILAYFHKTGLNYLENINKSKPRDMTLSC